MSFSLSPSPYRLIPFFLLLFFEGFDGRLLHVSKTESFLQTLRPYNIAHRGSNGEFPEETSAAYLRAIEEGADFIETDILSSKDGSLVCFHDVILDDTTDVADHKEFSGRRRSYEVQGINVTGWFTVDLTLEELKTLRTRQRYEFRDQQYNGMLSIITFEEYLNIALNAKRTIGIYPEIKNPTFINQRVKWLNGKKFEDIFVETLQKYGYKGTYKSKSWLRQPLFIQSFAPSSLIYISRLIDSPKILLIDDVNVPTQDTNQTYWEITSDNYLEFVKAYVVGIGPWKDTIVPVKDNYLLPPTNLVKRAHHHGLEVHPYTYRNENKFLHWNFSQDPYAEYSYWIEKEAVHKKSFSKAKLDKCGDKTMYFWRGCLTTWDYQFTSQELLGEKKEQPNPPHSVPDVVEPSSLVKRIKKRTVSRFAEKKKEIPITATIVGLREEEKGSYDIPAGRKKEAEKQTKVY